MALRIVINGKQYDHFQDFVMTKIFDSLASTFSFNGYFDTTNAAHRRIFRPLSYSTVQIFEDRRLLLTGTILNHTFNVGPKNNLVALSGYSTPGILGKVSIPTNLYPLETNQKTLVEITERLIEPFGISLVVDPSVSEDANRAYEKTTAKDKQSIGSYIAQLASQRNIIISHTENGELLFTRPRKNRASIATYRDNMPSTNIQLSTNGDEMHSELTVQKQSTIGSDLTGDSTVINPLIGQFRPLVKEQTKGAAIDAENAALNAISAELKNINVSVETDRWEWFDGRVVSMLDVNQYIDIISPENYIAQRANFFVNQIVFEENAEGRKAILNVVLPETFNGDTPRNIFTL